jgi:hypothetical protein
MAKSKNAAARRRGGQLARKTTKGTGKNVARTGKRKGANIVATIVGAAALAAAAGLAAASRGKKQPAAASRRKKR